MYKSKHGLSMKNDVASEDVFRNDYEALIIHRGFSPEYMRRTQSMVEFFRAMNKTNKIVAAICHGPWMMISGCDIIGRKLTGYYSISIDIENASAT